MLPRRISGLSDRLGPFKLLSRLGSGAFGTVYLAQLEEERPFARIGDKLAVKVLERVEEGAHLARFLREAELGQAVEHPSVVRTFCVGRDDLSDRSLHYLVMEYVEGRTLRQVMDQFGAVPESLLQALAIQITAALDAVHQAGAIHRDLKPTNILITEDYEVKLSDLGIARVAGGETSLTDSGMFVGTFNYSSPEQLQGRKVTTAADLYALGVVLYEAATGTQPFVAGSLEATFLRHLHEVPTRIGQLQPEISPFFEGIVGQLLEKVPEHRFSSAQELLGVLREGESSVWWLSRQKVLRAGGPRKRPDGFQTTGQELPFTGRTEDLEKLLASWRGCVEGRGGMVLVEGEAGIGKSRLLEEFHDQLQCLGTDHHVLYGSDSPGTRFAPGSFAQALVDHLGDVALEEKLEKLLPNGQRLAPGFAAYLRGLPVPSGLGPFSVETIHSLFHQVVKSLIAEKPVVWMVEDLHFASAETHALLASFAQLTRSQPLMIVATGRPGVTSKIGQMLQARVDPEKVVLRRFAVPEIEGILEQVLPMEDWLRFGRKIARRSDGNPLFLSEMIREAKGATVVSVDEAPHAWINEVPDSLQELLGARFEELDEADRALLQCAAVEGFDFLPEFLARVRRTNLLEVLEHLVEIERHHGLIKSTERGFRFAHHLLQEVAYVGLSPSLRRYYHQGLAQALMDSTGIVDGEEVRGERAVHLCEHFLKGGQGERGLPFALAALDHLAQSQNSEKLLELAEFVLSAAPQEATSLRVEVLLHQTECYHLLGHRAEEARAAEEAYELASNTGDASCAVRARVLQGRLLVDSGPHALGILEQAYKEVEAVGDASLEVQILGQLGHAHVRSGRFEQSLEFNRRQLALSRSLGEVASIAEANCSMGDAFVGMHRAAEATEPLQECIALCIDARLTSLEARAHQSLGLAWQFQAEYPKARRSYEKSLDLCRELGYLEMEIGALGNYSNLCLIEGNLRRAEELHARRKILSQARSTPFLDAYLHLEAGDLHRVRREFERSTQAYTAALELFTEIGAAYGLVEVWLGIGRVAFMEQESDWSRDCFEEAANLCHREGLPAFVPSIEAYRVALGCAEQEVPRIESLQLPERAEGHWLLSLALDSRDHFEQSLHLLQQMSAHLEGRAQEDFWMNHPVARAIRDIKEASYVQVH